MNIQPNILFASHKGAPFVGDEVHAHNLPQGAPFHNALSTKITDFASTISYRTNVISKLFLVSACVTLCAGPLIFAQEDQNPDIAQINIYREQAERGDAQAAYKVGRLYESVLEDYTEALRWFRKAAEQGNAGARLELGRMYLDGKGVERDYSEAASWLRCPKLDAQLVSSCTATIDLPQPALDLLTKMKCDVEGGAVYDYVSAIPLTADASVAYQVCCRDFHRDPCDAVLIGKVGSQWKNLTTKGGLQGLGEACRDLLPLQSQHNGIHDLCVPNQCDLATYQRTKRCATEVWQFRNGRYQSASSTVAEHAH